MKANSTFAVHYPDFYEGSEGDVSDMGVLDGLWIESDGKRYEVSVFTPLRLSQEVLADLRFPRPCYVQKNLIVVQAVDRAHIDAAVLELAKYEFADICPEPLP